MKSIMNLAFAEMVVKKLKAQGIEAHIYNVAQTGSIYIRFARKEFCSLRIGDHDGREKYKYKFNLRSDIENFYEEIDKNIRRYYYPFSDVDELVQSIRRFQESRKDYHYES